MVIHRVSLSLSPPSNTHIHKEKTDCAREEEGGREGGERRANGGDERERRSLIVGRSLSIGRSLSANL